jgi:hypothetical protein
MSHWLDHSSGEADLLIGCKDLKSTFGEEELGSLMQQQDFTEHKTEDDDM